MEGRIWLLTLLLQLAQSKSYLYTLDSQVDITNMLEALGIMFEFSFSTAICLAGLSPCSARAPVADAAAQAQRSESRAA